MRRDICFAGGMLLAMVRLVLRADGEGGSSFQFQFTEKAGPYPVGLRVVEQYDRSRRFQITRELTDRPVTTGGFRPMQTLVWYPGEAALNSEKMTVGDYAKLIETETSFDRPGVPGKPQSFVREFTNGTTSLPLWAVRDAPMHESKASDQAKAGGAERFPLVIYAPSLNAPTMENIELCEYLASHGFVVMATPSMGAMERTMTVDVAGANAEAQDIQFQIDYAKSLPDVEMSSVAVVGYSWGAMSALFAAARDQRIDAIVALDGSFRYSPAMVEMAGDVHPDQMKIPLLFLSRAEETLESWSESHQDKDQFCVAPNVLNAWTHGDLYSLRMLGLSHIQFSSMFQRSDRFRKEGLHFAPADYSLQEGAESYNWVVRYTLEFLQAYLKHNASALTFLGRTPGENGVPRHLMASSSRPRVDRAPVNETGTK